jgi:hypothetical protein
MAVVTTGVVVPNQLPRKFFRLVVFGAGSEPPVCRSTIWPYQFALMLLLVKTVCRACWGGLFVAPLPSRNSTPTVQLLVMKFSTAVMLSV